MNLLQKANSNESFLKKVDLNETKEKILNEKIIMILMVLMKKTLIEKLE